MGADALLRRSLLESGLPGVKLERTERRRGLGPSAGQLETTLPLASGLLMSP